MEVKGVKRKDMSRPEPQYGVQLSVEEIPLELPIHPIYGVSSSNRYIPIQVNDDGQLSVGNITISGPVTVSDVVIKGVDPDNGNTSEDVSVANLGSAGYGLRTSLYDGTNKLTINTDGAIAVAGLDVYGVHEFKTVSGLSIHSGEYAGTYALFSSIFSGNGNQLLINNDGSVSISASQAIPVQIEHNLDSVAIYGTDGTNDQFIKTDSSGNLQVGIEGSSSSVLSSVGASIVSVSLLAANPSRKTVTIYNDSSSNLYLALGTGVSATNFTVKLKANDYYEFPQPIYLGSVEAIWDEATGSARITEFS